MFVSFTIIIKVKKVFISFNVKKLIILALHHQDRPKLFIDIAYQFIMESLKSL